MVDRSIDHPLQPKRRWFLKTALAIGAVGAALGGSVFWHRAMSNGQLTEHGKDIFRGLARGYLGPMLPKDETKRQAVLDGFVAKVEGFMAGMNPVLQTELNGLLGSLANGPTRRMLTGLSKGWHEATDEELSAAIEQMRLHDLPTTRLVYMILRSVTMLNFFTISDNWHLTGYPGPIQI
jgi:hypothetical protein